MKIFATGDGLIYQKNSRTTPLSEMSCIYQDSQFKILQDNITFHKTLWKIIDVTNYPELFSTEKIEKTEFVADIETFSVKTTQGYDSSFHQLTIGYYAK